MAQALNMVPEFTQDTLPAIQVPSQEVDNGSTQADDSQPETSEEEKETPSVPPTEEKPAGEQPVQDIRVEQLETSVQALQEERAKLLRDLADLRGQRRELKQEQVNKIDQQLEDLKDVNPEDIQVIEKVIRSKGYVPKEEINKMFYESVKNEELAKFLVKYPEYKPENDSKDINWSALQKELGYYRMPENPHLVGEVLERAHRGISGLRISSDRDIAIKKQQLELAGKGGGGIQRSSSGGKTLTPQQRRVYEDGGWSEEEIKAIEVRLK